MIGQRIGPYEVLAKLGEGGMGEVYRARDVNLGREVAIKVLPEAFAQDAERLARFEREAKTLAALSHSNIAIVYGFEKAGEIRALVMELVEGPTLADLIERAGGSEDPPLRKPIPINEAIPIARQIAEALEAAHEQGVIHRDLKPANIKVRDDGTVKVLDFGLAKLIESGSGIRESGFDRTMSPTITTPAMTQLGVILGTAAYMAPEQARGKPVDKRSDIWAFGCVLFEMLAGTRAFDGEDATDTIAAVVRAEPKWDALPADVPPSIRLLVRRCLEKDRKKRIGDISTALFIMNESTLVSAPAIVAPAPDNASHPSKWRYLAWSTLAVALASAVAAGIVWMITRPDAPRVSRFELTTSGASAVALFNADRHLAITRDGSKVIYVGGVQEVGTALFVRSLDRLEPTRIADRGTLPFVSPDGEWVGFFGGNGTLRKVAVTGGPSIEIAKFEGGPRGAAWATDDTIIFATNRQGSGLLRVAAAGGTPVALTQAEKGTHHARPSLLPGGRGVLFTVVPEGGERGNYQVAVLDLRSPGARPNIVVRGGSDGRYLPSGHLVYLAENSVRAMRFDLDRLEPRGSAVPTLAPVAVIGNGGAGDFDIADDGTLVYLAPSGPTGIERSLMWVDRRGKEEAIPAPPRTYLNPRLSPDGTRVATDVDQERDRDIWVWDLVHGNATRVTKDAAQDRTPVWSADGESIFFNSTREGPSNIFRQRADGTGTAQRVNESAVPQFPLSLSADGTQLVFYEGPAASPSGDLLVLQIDASPKPAVRALVKTAAREDNGVISPDGRWLAYQSNESGSWDIYVRPMRDLERAARVTISTGGGTQPRWSRDGRELFYISTRNEMMGVPVRSAETWSSGTPVKLFDASPYFIGGQTSAFFNYDVSKDGRFLMLKPMGGATGEASTTTNIEVVQNWTDELKRLLPH